MSGSALATLTATYTDSEGDEEAPEEKPQNPLLNSIATPVDTPENKSTNSSRPVSPTLVRVTTKVAKLVSYHDDTIATDDENDADDNDVPQHEVIMLTENDDTTTTTITKAEMSEAVCEDGVQIPPEPPGYCSIDLQEKISRWYEQMKNQQLDMNAVIQRRKDFRNPSIYEKLIQFCDINELGTNYPASIYDPLKWGPESYYEELAKEQKIEMDKREKERKSKVEVVSGTKKQDDDVKKRKSKWDQPSSGNAIGSQNIKPAGLVQPSLTTSATGTKGTVISAFGSLPKKPRL